MLNNTVRWRTFKFMLSSGGVSRVGAVRSLCNPFKVTKDSPASPEAEPAKRNYVNPFGQSKQAPLPKDTPALQKTEPAKQNYVNPFEQAKPTPLPDSLTSETPEEREKRLKVLQLEADIAHQEGRRVPSLEFFQDFHWTQVLTLPTKSARIKYYAYLWQIEMKKESVKRKKMERAVETEQRIADLRKEREENTHIIYGLAHTSMFLRVYDSTINHWQNNRLTRAMQFAPKMVLDCSYDAHMNNREATYAAKQLMLSFAENRAHDEPFDLHFCNANFQGRCMQSLKRYIPTMLNPEFPMSVHSQCFTELFPKEQLVYLTPHCREDLQTYNPDDIYIVGAMVDTMNNEPLSLAKAKRLGLRMARLPLDHYLQWGSGSGKSLTLNQMINIMLDIRKTGDWNTALKHVPRRKLMDMDSQRLEGRNQLNKRAGKLNVRIDQLLKFEDDRREYTAFARPQKMRQRTEGQSFNLDNWAKGKKKTSQSS